MGHIIDPNKRCELCDKPRVKSERYCPRHRAAKLKEMRAAGYFTDTEELTVYEYERRENNRKLVLGSGNKQLRSTEWLDDLLQNIDKRNTEADVARTS